MANIKAFFKPTPKSSDDTAAVFIHWRSKTTVRGSTARIEVEEKARVGAFVTHPTLSALGPVKLCQRLSPEKLEVEVDAVDSNGHTFKERHVVDAVDCSHPHTVAAARDQSVYLPAATDDAIAADLARRAVAAAKQMVEGISSTASGKRKAQSAAKAKEKVPKKMGRPKGSADKQPRKRRNPNKIMWYYAGKKAPAGQQFAEVGDALKHDGLFDCILLASPNPGHLQIQVEKDGEVYAASVDATVCHTLHGASPSQRKRKTSETGRSTSEAGGSSGAPAKRRKGGGRKRQQLTETQRASGLTETSTKAQLVRVQKRKKREADALARGRPLKPLKAALNRKWPMELKNQALAIYNSTFADGERYAACTEHLLKLPGFKGLVRSLLRAWVFKQRVQAEQVPNEYGLIMSRAGRKPTLSDDMRAELVATIKALAATRGFKVTATSLKPIVIAFVVHRLGAQAIKPGKGGFTASRDYLRRLALAAGLRWRKPYGDARKPPADADSQIHDMKLRLAYTMKEFDIPKCLVVNFDHTGLHFMQTRGNTWAEVEVDTDTTHQSRANKQKEIKQQGINDKRQATGTVGSSFAGDVLPGQLIPQGVQHGHGAMSAVGGCKYVQPGGPNPGHAVGFQLARVGPDASLGALERKWLGHMVQTENHWANISTSYAILDQLIVPWLVAKKAAIGKAPDHPCILIVDCWYGWKDQDKKKTLQRFPDYLRQHYPWLHLLFVPAACTDLVQPADRGQVSWLKGNMRRTYNDTIAAEVLRQLRAGTPIREVVIDVSAPYLKALLARSFAKALSELPTETMVHCWAPLQEAFTKMDQLHTEASEPEELARLFPKSRHAAVLDGNEPEPDVDALDDLDLDDPSATDEAHDHERMYNLVVAWGVPVVATDSTLPTAAALPIAAGSILR